MAIKKVEIRPKGNGTYSDIVYPKTSTDMVVDEATGKTVSEHLADDVKHITAQERNTWNSKADGNHNHDGVYEPVLPNERKRRITFGTAEPSGGSDGDIYFQYE